MIGLLARRVRIDAVLIAHLRSLGMSDALIGHLAARVARGDGRAERRLRDATCSTPMVTGRRDWSVIALVNLEPGLSWCDRSLILTGRKAGIPQTIAARLTGRPLSDVVDHPMLPAGATITSVNDGAGIDGEPPGAMEITTDAAPVWVGTRQWSPIHLTTTLLGDVRHDQGLKFAVWTVGALALVVGMFALLALAGVTMARNALPPLCVVCGLTVAMSRSAWTEGRRPSSLSNSLHAEEAQERWVHEGRWG